MTHRGGGEECRRESELEDLSGNLFGSVDGVVEIAPVGSEGCVDDAIWTWRYDQHGIGDRDLAHPQTEFAVFLGDVGEVTAVRRNAGDDDVARRGEAGNAGADKGFFGKTSVEEFVPGKSGGDGD